MVANKNITQQNGLLRSPISTTADEAATNITAPISTSSIITTPKNGEYKRRMMSWRTPHLGIIQMYINPQNVTIQDQKDISANRTKAGFIIQYAGEKLTEINVSGTTGSSGIEGINILEAIYRSEQEAFTTIAQALDRQLSNAQLIGLFKGPNSIGTNTIQDALSVFLGQTAEEAALNIFEQPFPTLASLASNVELLYQGVVYRGFFKSFRVEERAEGGPGLFDYSLAFTAYAKQGVRRNFMPWHRQPYNPANVDDNPLSFSGSINQVPESALAIEPSQPFPEVSSRPVVGAVGVENSDSLSRRDFNNALGDNGQSLFDLNLEDTEA